MCLALVYVTNLSTPGMLDRSGQIKGTDFLHFYVLGSLARNGPSAALYDYRAQAVAAAALVPESTGVYYIPVYGPQVSLLFAPLARLSYAWALVLWLSITTLVYAACSVAVWRMCPALRRDGPTVALAAAAFPAFFNLLAHGQNSAIALACFTVAFFALKHERRWLAGLAIGMLAYKPQLGIVAACVFVLTLDWQVIGGAVVGAALQLGAAWCYYGDEVMRQYWQSLRGIRSVAPLLDVKPYQMHSLLSFWNLLAPGDIAIGLYVMSAGAVIVTLLFAWRAPAPLSLRYAGLLLATVLVSPHLNVYDLVILAPALLWGTDWALRHPHDQLSTPTRTLVYFAYVLPLFGELTRFTHVQASVPAMTALFGVIAARVLREIDVSHRLSHAAAHVIVTQRG